MSTKLPPKQELFIQNVVKGMSQRQAYRKAFPNSKKWKDNSVDNKASELFRRGEVQSRYEELMKKLEEKSIMTAQQRMKFLTEVVTEKQRVDVVSNGEMYRDVPATLNEKMKAIDLLNKMTGEYKTILTGSVRVEKKLEDLL